MCVSKQKCADSLKIVCVFSMYVENVYTVYMQLFMLS